MGYSYPKTIVSIPKIIYIFIYWCNVTVQIRSAIIEFLKLQYFYLPGGLIKEFKPSQGKVNFNLLKPF